MLLSRLRCKWRYRRLKKTLRHASVYETVEVASDLLEDASNAHALMFNVYMAEWLEHHFRMVHRQHQGRRRVLDNLWVLYREWKSAVTVKDKANSVFNLIVYTHGLKYTGRADLLSDFIDYLRNAK